MPSDLPASLADSWRQHGTRTGTSNVLLLSITAETTLYEPIDSADRMQSVGTSEIPVRSLFTVYLTFSPPLSNVGIPPSTVFAQAAPKAKRQFIKTIKDEGVHVDSTRSTLEFEAANGEAGVWYVIDASYPVDPDLVGAALEPIDAEVHVAVWPTETSYGMAGGTVPLESVADVAAGAELTLEELPVHLDVDPARDRETIAELIRTIDLETDTETD
ncbi:hypothetical protein [Natronorubrum sulfidifaciens]|uniref:Uncharacterized protein n=1 Tax=Natronorubrum sulfidifaciens JCM 14089 TaxID=1230460 RepID=L9W735_9EURY|nr:hypothetical protein [Natronorubrum sulfidifaciens]ELY45152.1 hypothetical protein C495_09425 [Natronorubrum sulfidifaciens JCM 14089]